MISHPDILEPASLPKPRRTAFTLVELLVVMSIIVLLMVLVIPAFSSIRSGGNFISAANDIGSTIEQARAYAMAYNTYVYVGVGEYLATESSTASPRTPGIGQIVLAVVASRDGTRGYDPNNLSTWNTNYGNAQNGASLLTAIDKLHFYDNVHLADFGAMTPASGKMARPAVVDAYRLGNASSVSSTPFSWPLGKALGATTNPYNFTRVIQIDPQGVARIQMASNTGSTDGIAAYMEIDLQPAHGNVAPAVPTDADHQNIGNQAALQVDCMTGATHVFHP